MKCARCGHDSTYPDRTDQRCPGCKGKFAFEPRTGDAFNDMQWKSAIDQVSSNGSVRFTLSHLHHAVARRQKKPSSALAVLAFVLAFFTLLISSIAGVAEGFAVVLGLSLIGTTFVVVRRRANARLSLRRDEFEQLYRRWSTAHGDPKGLIKPRPSRPVSADLADELESYSFDRAVICDRTETVDLLLGNDFHFENNCAVLTAAGYPEHAAPIVRKMIRKNPRLEVFVLHDATVEGCVLAHWLKSDPEWFADSAVRVFDVALRPDQARKMPSLVWHVPRDVPPHPALSADERAWLSEHHMLLAAITPEQVIKRLYRAMQSLPKDAKSVSYDGGGSSSDSIVIWTTDAHASDGGGDSFG